MTENLERQDNNKDGLIWAVIFIILAIAIVGNTFYNELNVAIRALGVLVLIAVATFLASKTKKGQATLSFAQESRQEIRKVVWPTRQETMQTTLMVLVVTAVMGFFLFLLDGALVWLINLVTGV